MPKCTSCKKHKPLKEMQGVKNEKEETLFVCNDCIDKNLIEIAPAEYTATGGWMKRLASGYLHVAK